MYTFDHALFLTLNFDGGPVMDRIMVLCSTPAAWAWLYVVMLWLVWRRGGWRARKEVIDEEGLKAALTERTDLKYITDIAPDSKEELASLFGKRFFATPKKMGAETAEANINAGLAAARQIVDYIENGNTRFQVNK